MYLHIVPKLYHLMENKCRLESVYIPELNFIIDGYDLSTGKPWPNKCVWVGMRKGKTAINGLLLKTDIKLKWFTTKYQWNIENMGMISHSVTTYIEDDDFDLVSQDILLNGGFDKWQNRVHSAYENLPPVKVQPQMESFLNKPGENTYDIWEEYYWGDFLVSREESLLLHTIQSERLNTDFSLFSRYPSFKQVINI